MGIQNAVKNFYLTIYGYQIKQNIQYPSVQLVQILINYESEFPR